MATSAISICYDFFLKSFFSLSFMRIQKKTCSQGGLTGLTFPTIRILAKRGYLKSVAISSLVLQESGLKAFPKSIQCIYGTYLEDEDTTGTKNTIFLSSKSCRSFPSESQLRNQQKRYGTLYYIDIMRITLQYGKSTKLYLPNIQPVSQPMSYGTEFSKFFPMRYLFLTMKSLVQANEYLESEFLH